MSDGPTLITCISKIFGDHVVPKHANPNPMEVDVNVMRFYVLVAVNMKITVF
jgi:hypothetical protein